MELKGNLSLAGWDCSNFVASWLPVGSRPCCRYSIHFTFITRRSGPSAFCVLGCTWLFFPSLHICFFARRSPQDSGLQSVSAGAFSSDSGATRWLPQPGSERHAARAGSSAHHTCCGIKGHSWKPGITGEVKLYFSSFLLCFWSPHLTRTPTAASGVSFHYWGEGVLRLVGVAGQQTDWLQPWAAAL